MVCVVPYKNRPFNNKASVMLCFADCPHPPIKQPIAITKKILQVFTGGDWPCLEIRLTPCFFGDSDGRWLSNYRSGPQSGSRQATGRGHGTATVRYTVHTVLSVWLDHLCILKSAGGIGDEEMYTLLNNNRQRNGNRLTFFTLLLQSKKMFAGLRGESSWRFWGTPAWVSKHFKLSL